MIRMLIRSKKTRRTGHVAHKGDMRNVYKILIRRPKEKISFGRTTELNCI
jgi:hypothetical protein